MSDSQPTPSDAGNAPEAQRHQDQLEENKLIAARREKLTQIRQQGIAFPNDFRRNVVAGELHAEYGDMDAASWRRATCAPRWPGA
jgi:lysyl-tRNA synthetase class 2